MFVSCVWHLVFWGSVLCFQKVCDFGCSSLEIDCWWLKLLPRPGNPFIWQWFQCPALQAERTLQIGCCHVTGWGAQSVSQEILLVLQSPGFSLNPYESNESSTSFSHCVSSSLPRYRLGTLRDPRHLKVPPSYVCVRNHSLRFVGALHFRDLFLSRLSSPFLLSVRGECWRAKDPIGNVEFCVAAQ